MAGGGSGMGVTGVSQTDGGQTNGGQTGYTPAAQPTSATSANDYYASLMQPGSTADVVRQAYQQTLGRAPEAEGATFWANQAQNQGWTGQQLAQAIEKAGAPERAKSGFTSQFDNASYGQQALNTPSYYNTNPFSVDYANIFNPYAKSVVSANPAMSPGQQAQYLQNWQADYNNRINSGVEAAKAAQIAEARRAQDAYAEARAKAEAEAKTNTQAAIDKAVQDALAKQASEGYGWTSAYSAAKGGIASLAKGFKK